MGGILNYISLDLGHISELDRSSKRSSVWVQWTGQESLGIISYVSSYITMYVMKNLKSKLFDTPWCKSQTAIR
jgi:hypothetical protein